MTELEKEEQGGIYIHAWGEVSCFGRGVISLPFSSWQVTLVPGDSHLSILGVAFPDGLTLLWDAEGWAGT